MADGTAPDLAARLRRHGAAATWVGASEIFPRLANFAMQLLLIRALARVEYGIFAYAFSLFQLAVPLAGCGLLELFVREGSRAGNRFAEVFAENFALRIVSAAASLVMVGAIALAHGERRFAIAGIGVFVLARALTQFLASSSRAQGFFGRETAARSLEAVVLLGVALAAIRLTRSLEGVVAALAVGACVCFAVFAILLRRGYRGVSLKAGLSARALLRAVPLGLPALSGVFLLRGALVEYERMTRDFAGTAYFAAAINIVLLAGLIPGFVAAALFPALSRQRERIALERRNLAAVAAIFGIFGAVLAAGLAVSAAPAIRVTCGPAYAGATPILIRLSAEVLFLAPSVFAATVLAAERRSRTIVLMTFVPLGLLGLAGVGVIPRFGLAGISVAAITAQALTAVWGFRALLKSEV